MDQATIYREHAHLYDHLVAAEDSEGELAALIVPLLPEGGTLVDVGTGTGRVSRLFAGSAAKPGKIVGVDRSTAMLDVAETHRARNPRVDWQLVEGDVRALPLASGIADLVTAGWVFAHFRLWMPDGWRADVDAALDEMARVAKPGARQVIIETLGTNRETPQAHPALDEYFAHLERAGFARQVVRTDYSFPDLEEAVRLLGAFFGEPMAEAVRLRGSARVPECTGVWMRR